MTVLDRLIRQLEERGLTVRPGDEPGALKLAGPDAEKTPAVMAALREFKPELLERFGEGSAGAPTRPKEAAPAKEMPGPKVCPVCQSEIYPAATQKDVVQVCDRAPCRYQTPALWRPQRV